MRVLVALHSFYHSWYHWVFFFWSFFFIVVLICISQITNEVEQFFICLYPDLIPSLVKFLSTCPFLKIELFLTVQFREFFIMSSIYDLQIFPSMLCLKVHSIYFLLLWVVLLMPVLKTHVNPDQRFSFLFFFFNFTVLCLHLDLWSFMS